jgi:adenylate cyclase
MSDATSSKKSAPLLIGAAAGVMLTVLVGIAGLSPTGDWLGRLSYDLPFLFESQPPDELVMVYLDDKVKRNLGQPTDEPLDRHYHTELLQRLTADDAKLVLFDILFDTPHINPSIDDAFASALRQHGRAILVGDYIKQLQGNILMDSPLPPLTNFTAAARWGLGKISPDADSAVRRLDTGVEDYPSASWVAAQSLGARVTQNDARRLDDRWLNYYCSPDQFAAINFDHAIEKDGLPAGYFRDKIVVVGARPSVGMAGAAREEFQNPYSRFGRQFSSGPSVHALSMINLIHGDWLVRIRSATELGIVLVWGIFISLALLKFRPWLATIVAALCAAAFAGIAISFQLRGHIWFAWAVPVFAQTSVALIWSIVYQYVVESRRRRQLKWAFGAYLSPYMADQIANSEYSLALGGQEVEASVMFTDLEGFTKMSESLPPSEVSKILVAYFNQTTRAILEQDGTIVKYIGDAVMAVWGAPLPEKNHAQRAVMAAWGMNQAGKQEIEGRRLRTRIGVNTGIVLSGNLGSEFRFDYTCIGDTTNFAARLEGLNKYLGTDVLISEFTAQQLDGSIKLRPLGKFLVAGKNKAIGIFEVHGPTTDFLHDPPWFTEFAKALEHFQRQELDAAEKSFRQTIVLRDSKDGPSEFYLKEISKARHQPPAEWSGDIVLYSK